MNHLENLKVLRQAVFDEPERLFNLKAFAQPAPCGTLHCTLGLACTLPHFQEQGLRMFPGSWPRGIVHGQPETINQVCARLFGTFPFVTCWGDTRYVNAYAVLFEPRREGDWDEELFEPGMTDKDLALARLDHAIFLLEQA